MWHLYFAVYRGDRLLAVGTKDEVCGQLGITPRKLDWMASESNRERDKGKNRHVAIRFKMSDEELEA